jgi:very-short-patch-repair endonuclease
MTMQIDRQRSHARHMRKTMTRAEVIPWVRLRNRNLGGYRFNRQVAIGPFIVDFLCRARKLIVEVDGTLHEDTKHYDARRTAFLVSKGYHMTHFWNEDVYGDVDDVLQRILERLENITG